jgi:dephospho-CoA kinase
LEQESVCVRKRKNSTLRVGVTGGIGSGKSLVCSMFADLGIPVLSADELAKQLMNSDQRLRRRLRALLGVGTYSKDGSLNRAYVASRIFSDSALQQSVNKLVHPVVEQALGREFDALARRGTNIAIVEAALIYEAGYDKELDLVIVVDAPRSVRVQRVLRRDGARGSDVRKRMRAQWPVRKKLQRADYIIRNKGSRNELRRSVRLLANVLSTIAGSL